MIPFYGDLGEGRIGRVNLARAEDFIVLKLTGKAKSGHSGWPDPDLPSGISDLERGIDSTFLLANLTRI